MYHIFSKSPLDKANLWIDWEQGDTGSSFGCSKCDYTNPEWAPTNSGSVHSKVFSKRPIFALPKTHGKLHVCKVRPIYTKTFKEMLQQSPVHVINISAAIFKSLCLCCPHLCDRYLFSNFFALVNSSDDCFF